MGQYERTERLLGEAAMARLRKARVAVFGIGGVGGYAAEALARSGVGALDLFDHDRVSLTNLNRQIIALHSTLGRLKVDVMRERILDIDPSCDVRTHAVFYLPENAEDFDLTVYSCIVDAVDTVAAKLTLIEQARKAGVPVISAMGAGNKLDPSRLRIADISETSVCPLARVMRRELRKRGIAALKVAYSAEEPVRPLPPSGDEGETARRAVPGSAAFVPSAMGLLIASEVVRDLTQNETGDDPHA